MPHVESTVVPIDPSSGAKKLGQPVPLSNFRSATNSDCPQPAHLNVPARCSRSSAHDPGRSVPCPRSTAYCSGVRMRFHSSSVFSTGKCCVLDIRRILSTANYQGPTTNNAWRLEIGSWKFLQGLAV